MPNFEVLDARIASALNKIIHNFQKEESVWRNKRPRKRTVSFEVDRLPTWATITSGSLEPMILSKNRPTCSLLFFEMTIFRNSILSGTEFYCPMTKIPPDEILEGLYKLRIRESDKLKTVLELYDLEIHEKKLGPDYHRLKTMVKRSIEQDIRSRNFGKKNRKFWEERRGQESGNKTACTKNFLEIVGNGKPNRAVFLEETSAVSATIWISVEKVHHQIRLRILPCGRMSENHREHEVPEVGVPVVARGMGSSRHATNRRRRTRKGPEPACVLSPPFLGVAHAGGAVVPSSRRGNTSSESRRRENRAAPKGQVVATWYGDDSPHLSLPNSQPCVGGSKGTRQGNRQGWWQRSTFRWGGRQLTLDKTVGSPSVATHSRLQRATSVRSRVGIVLEDGSGVAVDWVTGRSYSSARRRLNVQSGQRKVKKVCRGPFSERCRPVIVDTEKVLREADGSVKLVVVRPHTDGKVVSPRGASQKPDGESQWGARRAQAVKFKKAIARHTKIRDQNPSLGYICPGEPHERSPNAPKFEDQSLEETEWQEQGAREAAWKLAKRVFKIKGAPKSNILLTFGK